ncbi:MAG TPA: hypothetical protein VMG82_22710 [Candidatus Sulfotelmatobacter sp.]|nr:hypothetical protein [Candidatus Sulfotelmatobacter sp.]
MSRARTLSADILRLNQSVSKFLWKVLKVQLSPAWHYLGRRELAVLSAYAQECECIAASNGPVIFAVRQSEYGAGVIVVNWIAAVVVSGNEHPEELSTRGTSGSDRAHGELPSGFW